MCVSLLSEEEVVALDDATLVNHNDPTQWWRKFCEDPDLDDLAHSSKLYLLFKLLQECEVIGDKVLVFSQSLYSLNVIEYFLEKIDQATQQDKDFCGFTGAWHAGLDYYRLDGSTSCENRSIWCNNFNNADNLRSR